MATLTLVQAIATIKAGRRAEGRTMLDLILENDPRNVNALLWMTEVVDSDNERYEFLKRILEIQPNHALALRGLEKIDSLSKATIAQPVPALVSEKTLSEVPMKITRTVLSLEEILGLMRQGRYAVARQALKELLDIDPNNVKALFYMAKTAYFDSERNEYLKRLSAIASIDAIAKIASRLTNEELNLLAKATYNHPFPNPINSAKAQVNQSGTSRLNKILFGESPDRVFIGRISFIILMLVIGLVLMTITATIAPRSSNTNTTDSSLHSTDNGYAWHSASAESKASLCRNLAGIFSNNGVTHSWNFYYDVLNSVYNTTDPNVLKQPINEVAADAAVMSNAP